MKSKYIILFASTILVQTSFAMQPGMVAAPEAPEVVLGTWENKTGHEIEFYTKGKPTGIKLKAGEKIDLNFDIFGGLGSSLHWNYNAAFGPVGSPRDYVQIYSRYNPQFRTFRTELHGRHTGERGPIYTLQILIEPEEIANNLVITINGIIKGDDFDETQITFEKRFRNQ